MRAALVLSLLCLVGCRKVQPCPEPPIVTSPIDPVDLLAPGAPPADIAKAFAASRLIWKAEAFRRGDFLDAYRKRVR